MSDLSETPWRCIRRADDQKEVAEAGLVLTSVGIVHHIEHEASEWRLWVPEMFAARADFELSNYRSENRPAPPRPPVTMVDTGWAGVLGYLLVIWVLPTLEAYTVFDWSWRTIGRMEAGPVEQGEWWRTITALTLHANLGHIVANSAFGSVFGLFLGRHLGSGFGWLLVLVCAALANYFNAWVQPDDFRSIGASTATFATLGLVAAFVWRRGYYRGRGWRRSVAPMFAAIALLAYTGVGGENVDLVAHFAGFACGVVAGVLVAPFDSTRLGRRGQCICGVAALGLVGVAWMLAGQSGG